MRKPRKNRMPLDTSQQINISTAYHTNPQAILNSAGTTHPVPGRTVHRIK